MKEPAKKPRKPRAPRKTKKPSADAVSSAKAPIGIDGNATDEPMRTLNQEYKPDSRKNLVGLGWLAGSMDSMTREEHIAKLNDLATNGRLTEISSSPAPISSLDPVTTQVDSQATEKNSIATIPNWIPLDLPGKPRTIDGKDGTGTISQPTSANFLEEQQTEQGKTEDTEATDGSSQSPLPTNSANEKNQGDIAIGPAAVDSQTQVNSIESVLPPARARDGETKGQCRERLRQEARTSGMTRRDAISYAGRMVEQVWLPPPPPPEPVIEPIIEEIPDEPEPETSTIVDELSPHVEPIPEVAPPAPPADLGVSGLGELPESWGNLPANAQLQVEIAWVSANRLRVRSGNGVDLSRALSPAPSYSALSWLETSILFPSKFADISVKATSQQDDEREHIKREKMAIEEIRSILKEMLEG